MPRPILRGTMQQNTTQQSAAQQTAKQQGLGLQTRPQQRQTQARQQTSQMELDRLLRKPRSKEYMEAMHCLDNGGHVHNQYKVNAIVDAIRKEFPEVELAGVFLGVVSRCYLGNPYEVHTLDLAGNIIEHFKGGQTLPNGMERARGIALCGSYEFVEVYSDCCRAISAGGSVAVIR